MSREGQLTRAPRLAIPPTSSMPRASRLASWWNRRKALGARIGAREAVLVVLVLELAAAVAILAGRVLSRTARGPEDLAAFAVVIALSAALIAYQRGWDPSRYVAAAAITLAVAGGMPEPFVTTYAPLLLALPPAVALVLVEPLGVAASAAATVAILAARAGGRGVYTNPEALAIYAMVVGALMASRVILENARRRAEAQAAELAAARPAVERLAAIVEQSQDAIASLTVNGVITSWNKGAERLFGYSAAEAIGRQAVDLFSAGDARTQLEAQWGPFIQARVSRGEAFEMDQERPRKDGTTIQMRVSVSPLFDDQGRVAGASVIWHDISDRVALERRQRELNEELERRVRERTAELERTAGELRAVNAELESFSYSVSHDLRSPLRGIDGFSQALIEDYGDQLPEQGRRYLGLVRKGTLEMSQLIDDLLRLAQASRADLRAERVDLSGLAGEVVATLRGLDASRAVDIQIESGLVVEGDALLLRTVMDNLLANAWKFTRTRPRGRIEFRKVMGDPTPAYVVRDNGVGFDPAFAHKLFRPFQRLHAASEFEGTGVGLATVRRIVERHGGRVWAEATTDGSSFYFTIADRLGGAS